MEEPSTIEYTSEQVSDAIDKADEPTDVATDVPTNEGQEPLNQEDSSTKEEKSEPQGVSQEENKITCPQKFLSQDGTPDLNKILEAYTNLESSYTQKTQEYNSKLEQLSQAKQQEQENIAIQAGFDSYQEQQIALVTAERTANSYSQYIDYLEDEEQYKVSQLLDEYARTGNQNLLATIEDNFGTDIVKQVSNDSAIFERDLRNAVAEQLELKRNEELQVEAQTYVQNAIDTYHDWFEIKPFYDFFSDALGTKGAFDVGAFVNHISNLREYFRQELMNELNSKKENDNVKNSIINQTPSSNTNQPSKFDMKNSSDAEYSLEISKYI